MCTPDTVNRELTEADLSVMRHIVSHKMPLINGALVRTATCMYTTVSDGHFLIDFYPNAHKNVVLCSPCSGHGFKFCSVVGEIVADLVQLGQTRHDISLFALYNRDLSEAYL